MTSTGNREGIRIYCLSRDSVLNRGWNISCILREQYLKTDLTLFRSDIENWIIWVPGTRGYWEGIEYKQGAVKRIGIQYPDEGNGGMLGYRVSGTYAYTSSINYGDPGGVG